MSARSLSQVVVLIIALIGLISCLLRYQGRQATRTAMEESRWQLTYDLQLSTGEAMADEPAPTWTIGLPVPKSNLVFEKEPEVFFPPELVDETPENTSPTKNERVYSTRRGGDYELRIQMHIKLGKEVSWRDAQAMESLGDNALNSYRRPEEKLPLSDFGIQSLVKQAPSIERGVGEAVQSFFDFCASLGEPGKNEGGDSVQWVMFNKRASELGRVRTFVTLCRAASVPARLVSGFELQRAEKAIPHIWAEVFIEHRWVPFDPSYGYAWRMPVEFIPVRRGSDSVVTITGTKKASPLLKKEEYSIRRQAPHSQALERRVNRSARLFDLTRLPVQTHEMLSLMLLLPLGALITAFFRNVIGIRTFGIFSPALLAMSFIYAAWGTGVVILVVVVIAGLGGRWMLERLHLLMVPRLSIVLTIIIMCLVFCVSALYSYYPSDSSKGVLLPLVILTILIERFHVTAEEDGYAFALQLVVGTTIVSAFCYLLLMWDYIGRLLLVYPEAHFFTIALFILIGRYSGYRLVELWRFRDLVKPQES